MRRNNRVGPQHVVV